MAATCDGSAVCPRCGYPNEPGATRCVRCLAALAVPAGCSGECSRCLIRALAAPPKESASPARTKFGRRTSK